MAPWVVCYIFCSGGVCVRKQIQKHTRDAGHTASSVAIEIVDGNRPAEAHPVQANSPVEAVVGVPVPQVQPVHTVSSSAVVVVEREDVDSYTG
jgi:hypothetical protein